MEGAGPSHGTPKQIGAIIAGQNPATVDVVGCKIMDINPMEMPTIQVGVERGYLQQDLSFEILGESVDDFVVKGYKVPKPNNFKPFTF